jgi:hypothetical protein
MNHETLLFGNARGIPGSDCRGHLVEHARYPDQGDTVVVWRCEACEALIPCDSRGPRNAYTPFVCALAEALDMRRGLD